MAYDPKSIETKWQAHWEKNGTFRTSLDDAALPKYYVLDMFPYPSAHGLHVGHVEGYTATDILARYKRARGFNVLHPMGWDAFGLPAEQYAIATGVHPEITTRKAIDNFKRQLKLLGFSYDWDCEVATCDPDYYKWTQFIFEKLHERGLVYQAEMPVNWCPALKTVLANEEVVDGKSERGGHPVQRIPMRQWMLRITTYAERLLGDLDKLDWPESTKEAQRNWIGRSEGLQGDFALDAHAGKTLTIYTTRPDTIFGVTFMVVAPEHPMVKVITTAGQRGAVEAYCEDASRKSDILRQDASKEKTGVFTGAHCVNPVNGAKMPVWVADYVMMGYGTGAIMAVPAHDERDEAFAKKYDLPIIPVIDDKGLCINSGFITGKPFKDGGREVIGWFEQKKLGRGEVKYKLRDWLFSRQRYWGEPIPVVFDSAGAMKLVPVGELPVKLPAVESYEPAGTGESPLAAITDWVNVPGGKRTTDTMPGSAGSSWYFLRYIDPKNSKEPWQKGREKHWLPVDLYLGGPEHAVGHLLYSRFWMKVLFDLGLVAHDEPFQKLVHQGMILGEDGEKMSKSRGNVVSPDDVIESYGADSLRLYEMFMGPLEKEKPWSTSAIDGVHRFLGRVWRLYVDDSDEGRSGASQNPKVLVTDEPASAETRKILHKTIRQVTEACETLRFNTAISHMMVFVNHMTKVTERPREALRPFAQLLQPYAPHAAEELWALMGEGAALSRAPWPVFDAELAKDSEITVAVQVLGKTRGTVLVAADADQVVVELAAKADVGVAKFLEGKVVRKVIYVPGKIINFVVG